MEAWRVKGSWVESWRVGVRRVLSLSLRLKDLLGPVTRVKKKEEEELVTARDPRLWVEARRVEG